MFTTPPLQPVLGFTDDVDTIRGAWLTYVGNNYPSALDADGGGYYQLSGASIEISSDTDGFVLNFPSASDPIELRGYVTIGLSDDPSYATGVGTLTVAVPATFTAAVTYSGAMIFNNTVAFNGAVTFGSGGDITLASGCALTAASGSSITVASGGAITVANGATLTLEGSTGITFGSARSYTRSVTGTIAFNDAEWSAGTNGMYFTQSTAPGSGGIQTVVSWVLDVPAGSTITSITWYVDPAGGHGALPAILPSLLVRELDPATGSSTLVITMTDTSGSVAAYEAAHTVSSGVLSYATTAGRVVVAAMVGEKGANEVSGGAFYPPVVTFTRTSAREA